MALALRDPLRHTYAEYCSWPDDVRLPRVNEADDDVDTVAQPDISVVYDRPKLDERGAVAVRRAG